jgi:hypothetical protein
MICACGVYCEKCLHFNHKCAGCNELYGRVYWTESIGAEICPIYHCAKDKSFTSCGDCAEVPCQLWYLFRDPSLTDSEHQQSIHDRIFNLKGIKAVS